MKSLDEKLEEIKNMSKLDVWYIVKQETDFLKVMKLVHEWDSWTKSGRTTTYRKAISNSSIATSDYRATSNAYNYGLLRNDAIIDNPLSKASYDLAELSPVWNELKDISVTDFPGLQRIIDRQIEKMYISNPYDIESRKDGGIRSQYNLYIVPTIYAILLELRNRWDIHSITFQEFVLFVETTTSFDDYAETAYLINEFRKNSTSSSFTIENGQSDNRVHLALSNLSTLNIDKKEVSLNVNQITEIESKVENFKNNIDNLKSLNQYQRIDLLCSERDIWSISEQNLQQITSSSFQSKLPIGKNIIFYGAPGTGKSHDLVDYINEESKGYITEDYTNESLKDAENVFRVTLHPEYEYSDFLGQLLPTEDNSFKFSDGIFLKSLRYAIKNENTPVFMILEEMSRANVAAVFGDLFQLLDRKNGVSEYAVDNPTVVVALNKELPEGKKVKSLSLPSNLYIIGTVNTSDQNVFVMDTAFKRRFIWKYKSTNIAEEDREEFNAKNNAIIALDKKSNISWYDFYTTLNDFITDDLDMSEDKQIGPFFVKFDDLNNPNKAHKLIQDKLLQYLWEDINTVAKNSYTSEKRIFNPEIKNFSDLYTNFKDNKNIFSNELYAKLKLKFDNAEETNNDDEATIED
ncbi:AlwI family type II restriction endonuclease [Ligilactobacillus equi]|uniref:McrB family protein n=1 Tax=Ligilactobacillus equi TaxID=137357 RepID=UPI002ED64C52